MPTSGLRTTKFPSCPCNSADFDSNCTEGCKTSERHAGCLFVPVNECLNMPSICMALLPELV